MKYLILLKYNPEWRAAWIGFSREEQAEMMELYAGFESALRERGEFIDADQLAGAEAAKTVSRTSEGVVATDAPFAELKEYLGGYYLVDVESEARAIEIAGWFPEADRGLVEIVPVMADAPGDA
ncbi:YciI family protein [Agromyces sp. LHK192]|uniref:YciI family protein n=1 Tax=Agromyces sp. LHK192 TaxID=2498704 RepID=UPI000FD6F2DA|nr:YciI family protein [Agromyces sp. LHK192]